MAPWPGWPASLTLLLWLPAVSLCEKEGNWSLAEGFRPRWPWVLLVRGREGLRGCGICHLCKQPRGD